VTTPQPSTSSERVAYWAVALRFYAKAAFLQSAVVWATGLVVPPLLWVLHIRPIPVRAVVATMAIGVGIGATFFVGMLGTAIGYDVRRNWHQSDPTVEWNPLWFWKLFLYAGSLMLLAFAFLSYGQGWWLPFEFVGIAVLSWFAAQSMAVTVRMPKRRPPLEDPGHGESTHHGHRLKHWGGGHLHPGFVAMEYFALILNRSFLVFITDEGLRCWKFHGLVSSLEPLFFQPVEALLDDPDMTPGSEPFEELMCGRHSFSIQYSEIGSVEFVDRQKWGMGPVPHTGRLRIRFRGLRPHREFILLGNAHGKLLRDMIASRIPSD
jgi:hypothetical protein